ncbi:MAG: hypothetical protein FJZ10_05415 [Candidatus Omnitrophica bacterium]|nr:hypothetical protein [Candidatus Omnitrophota bacterium]
MKSPRIILLFLFLSVACFAFAEEKLPFVAQATSETLNIRAGYNINFEVVYKLKKDDKVTVLEKKFNWCKVGLPEGSSCFISTKYVNRIVDRDAAVGADRVNVRARPDLKSSVLCQLGKNDPVTIVEDNDKDWYRIYPPKNCYGWVNEKYLKYYFSIDQYNKEKQQESTKLQDSRKPLEKTAPAISLPQQKFEYDDTGTVMKSGFFFKQPGTHKLIQNGKVVSFLKSDKAKLDDFLNLQVRARGSLEKDSGIKYPVVIVEDISIIE